MTDRSIVVRFRAEVSGFRSAMADATASTEGLRVGSAAAGTASVEASEKSAVAAQAAADKKALAADKAAVAQKAATEKAAAAQDKADAEAIKSAQMRTNMAGVGTKEQMAAYDLQSAAADRAAKAAEDAATREELASRRASIAATTSADAQVVAAEREAAADATRAAANDSAVGQMVASADKNKSAWDKVGTTILGVGAIAAVGLGAAVAMFAEFDSKMSQVQSLSHAGATEMSQLTTAALTVGQGIGYSASAVADAEIEMTKAGLSIKDMMGGALPGALNLAAAGQINVADATEIATIAMTQFGLSGQDVPHLADLLAAGADKALGGVSDLGWALKAGGIEAHQFGWDLNSTVGVLADFAQHGILGETAGTTLKQMLMKLADPSAGAADTMKKLGISVYDASGNFVTATELAGRLQTGMSGLDTASRNAALGQIFGSRAIQAANIFYSEGATNIQAWIDNVNVSGFAASQAVGKMDNARGDMSKLSAAFQTSMIEMGSSTNSFIRPVIQNITTAVQSFEALPEPTKGLVTEITGVVAVTALAAGGFITLAPKAIETMKAFKTLKEESTLLSGAMKGVGIAGGVAVAALVGMSIVGATTMQKNTPTVDEMSNSILKLRNNANGGATDLDSMFSKWDKTALSQNVSSMDSFADSIRVFTHQGSSDAVAKFMDPVMGMTGNAASGVSQVTGRLKQLGDVMGQYVSSGSADTAAKSFRTLSTEFEKNGKTAQDAMNTVPGYRDALLKQAQAAGVSLDAQDLLDYAMGKIPDKMQAAIGSSASYVDAAGNFVVVTKDQQTALDNVGIAADGTITHLDKLVTAMEQAGLIHVDAKQAEINFAAAADATNTSIDDNIKALQQKYQAQIDATKVTYDGADAAAKNAQETENNKKKVDDLVKAHIDEAYSIDIKTESGRKNMQTLLDIESKGYDLAVKKAKDATDEATGEADVKTALQATYDQLIANEGQLGITGTAADDMAKQLMKIPPDVSIDAWIHDEATKQLQAIGIQADNLNGKKATITVNTVRAEYLKSYFLPSEIYGAPADTPKPGDAGYGVLAVGFGGSKPAGKANGGPIQHLATGGNVLDLTPGGAITGPGSKTSDSVPIWASAGEFMESAKAVDKYGLGFMHSVNDLTYDPSAGSGFASPMQYSAPSQTGNNGFSDELKAMLTEALMRPQFTVLADKGIDKQQLAKDIAAEFKWKGLIR